MSFHCKEACIQSDFLLGMVIYSNVNCWVRLHCTDCKEEWNKYLQSKTSLGIVAYWNTLGLCDWFLSEDKALEYVNRSATELSKKDLLKKFKTLQSTARCTKHGKVDYYQLAVESARNKIDFSTTLGPSPSGCWATRTSKRCLRQVEKAMAKESKRERKRPGAPYRARQGSQGPRRCYYCNNPGHVWARCLSLWIKE